MEVRTCKDTEDVTNLQKAADFVRAFIFGFEVEDALALLRLDDLFIDSFEIQVLLSLNPHSGSVFGHFRMLKL